MPIVPPPDASLVPPAPLREAAVLRTACRAADSHRDMAFDLSVNAKAAVILLASGADAGSVAEMLSNAVDEYERRRRALVAQVMSDLATPHPTPAR